MDLSRRRYLRLRLRLRLQIWLAEGAKVDGAGISFEQSSGLLIKTNGIGRRADHVAGVMTHRAIVAAVICLGGRLGDVHLSSSATPSPTEGLALILDVKGEVGNDIDVGIGFGA
jgi:hypothetical protein